MNKVLLLSRVQKTAGVALAISYLLAVYAIIRTQIMPGKYLAVIIPITAIVIAFLVFTHLKKTLPAAKSIALSIFSLLLTVLSLYIFSAGSATTSFLDKIQEDGYTTEEYSIIAKKDRGINLSTNNKSTALLSTDTNNELVKAEVNKKTKTTYKEYAELTSLTAALNTKDADTSAVKSSYVQLLEENNNTFYQSIEILATFTIKVKIDSTGTKTDITKPFVVYISGIDTYGAVSSVSRSDVNMLAVINPVTHQILLVNTPRDYYVQLHGTTGVKDKLTHAGIYGIDMSVNTLQDLYGVHIDYYMRVNFASLMNIVDTLGGVDVYSDYAFKTGNYSFNTSYNHLDGKAALAFSRERYSFEDGDRTRGKNQQRVIEAIVKKLSSPTTLLNYQSVLKSLDGAFQTNASSSEVTGLIKQQMDDMRSWQTESISVDGAGAKASTYSMGAMQLYVMVPNQASLDSAKQKISQYQQ
jgi:polyisoprenyl-teichoic acid--peptidoglycan teichoic acid transferase